MTLRQHRQAVTKAVKLSAELKEQIESLGTRKTPWGRITSIYARYLPMLKGTTSITQARFLLAQMRKEILDVATELNETVYTMANEYVDELFDTYDLLGRDKPLPPETAVVAIMATFDSQRDRILAGLRLDADKKVLYGDGQRVGVLTYGSVNRDVAHFAPTLISYIIDYRNASENYYKQAVAALDFRTTMCCILVHGQVQEWKKPFELRGTPKFADRIMFPPFHLWCRTVVTLVHERDVDDDITREMRAKANTYDVRNS